MSVTYGQLLLPAAAVVLLGAVLTLGHSSNMLWAHPIVKDVKPAALKSNFQPTVAAPASHSAPLAPTIPLPRHPRSTLQSPSHANATYHLSPLMWPLYTVVIAVAGALVAWRTKLTKAPSLVEFSEDRITNDSFSSQWLMTFFQGEKTAVQPETTSLQRVESLDAETEWGEMAELITYNQAGSFVVARDAQITDEQTAQLVNFLKRDNQVISLQLNGNRITPLGAIGLAECLRSNVTLRDLFLEGNQVTDAGACALAEAVKESSSLYQLDLSANRVSCIGALALAKCLQTNSTLQALSLQGNFIGDNGAQALISSLKENRGLELLDLGANNISDRGISVLEESLKENTTLKTLGLAGNRISAASAAMFKSYLASGPSLRVLNLDANELGDDGFCEIAEGILRPATKFGVFKEDKLLEELSVRENGISDKGARSIASMLTAAKCFLLSIDVGGNRLSDRGVGIIAESLARNDTLTSLDVSGNNVSSVGATALANAVKAHKSLRTLVLSNNKLFDDAVLPLAQALETNTVITRLDLSGNSIDEGVGHFAKAMKKNKTLKILNLSGNRISDYSVRFLAEGLEGNTTLALLILKDNQFSFKGASILVEALNQNSTLSVLDLSGNNFTEEELSVLQASSDGRLVLGTPRK